MVYRRIPRVRRIEYLIDFLETVKEGYNKERAQEKLAIRKRNFELEKAKALGRGRPFMSKLKKSENLETDCFKLALQMGYIEANGLVRLTEDGYRILTDRGGGTHLLESLLETYPSFVHYLLVLKDKSNKEFSLPLKRDSTFFKEVATQIGLNLGQTSAEVIRDLLSQLGVVNWFVERIRDKLRYSRVYLVSKITNKNEISKIKENAPCFKANGREYVILKNECKMPEFKKVLWSEYLREANYVPRRPVFYSKLRDKVCYKLRISDATFDRYIQEVLKGDQALLVVGSGGMLPYTRDSTSLLKNLPLKTEDGEYIIYLKMDVKT